MPAACLNSVFTDLGLEKLMPAADWFTFWYPLMRSAQDAALFTPDVPAYAIPGTNTRLVSATAPARPIQNRRIALPRLVTLVFVGTRHHRHASPAASRDAISYEVHNRG